MCTARGWMQQTTQRGRPCLDPPAHAVSAS